MALSPEEKVARLDLDQIQKGLSYRTQHGFNDVGAADTPSIWQFINQHASNFVGQAIEQANGGLALGGTTMDRLQKGITNLLQSHLDHVAAWHRMGQGNHSVNEDVDDAVSAAVDQALNEINVTGVVGNRSQFEDRLVKVLDREIEIDVMNQVLQNSSSKLTEADDDFFHNLPFKDETLFVVLLCMAIIVPIILITLFLLYFYKRRKENIERRHEMLLQNQADFSMDEYQSDQADGRNDLDEDVPDLILKNLSV